MTEDTPEWTGWYRIAERGDLYVDGTLQTVYIDCMHVTERSDGQYHAEHYDRSGRCVTGVTVDTDDLRYALGDSNDRYLKIDEPDYIQTA